MTTPDWDAVILGPGEIAILRLPEGTTPTGGMFDGMPPELKNRVLIVAHDWGVERLSPGSCLSEDEK